MRVYTMNTPGVIALIAVIVAIIVLIASGFMKDLILGVAGFALFAFVAMYMAYIALYRKLPLM
jgi:hypothetical protein